MRSRRRARVGSWVNRVSALKLEWERAHIEHWGATAWRRVRHARCKCGVRLRPAPTDWVMVAPLIILGIVALGIVASIVFTIVGILS